MKDLRRAENELIDAMIAGRKTPRLMIGEEAESELDRAIAFGDDLESDDDDDNDYFEEEF